MVHIGNDWDDLLSEEIQKEYGDKLQIYKVDVQKNIKQALYILICTIFLTR